MFSVIGVGDNTVDRYLHLGKMFPGGNAVNVAVHARRMGCRAAYLGWMANDPHGCLVHQALTEEGVDLSHSRIIEGYGAFCEITLKDGDRVFGEYSDGVCSQISLNQADLEYISGFDLVHTSVYSHLDDQLEILASHSKTLSYDFSQEWDKVFLKKILPFTHFALISNPEESIMANEDLINYASSIGSAKLLITNGKEGAVFFDGSSLFRQKIIRITGVVDTLGAGDAFAARFMVDYLKSASAPDALENAAHVAAQACTYFGAFGHGAPIYLREKDS
jgi:fructoselysine 6-kinase